PLWRHGGCTVRSSAVDDVRVHARGTVAGDGAVDRVRTGIELDLPRLRPLRDSELEAAQLRVVEHERVRPTEIVVVDLDDTGRDAELGGLERERRQRVDVEGADRRARRLLGPAPPPLPPL